jgi:hypothetical protein
MFNPVLVAIILKTLGYGACGSVVGVVLRFLGRRNPGPRLDQAAAIGFLIGAGFGATFGIFQALLVRP